MVLSVVAMALLIGVAGLVRATNDPPDAARAVPGGSPSGGQGAAPALTTRAVVATPAGAAAVGATASGIFDDGRFLVAYYGTAGTGALGVLGETDPDAMHRAAARRGREPFRRPSQPVLPVYELIVTVADRSPGADGDYSHDIDHAARAAVHRGRAPQRRAAAARHPARAQRLPRRRQALGVGAARTRTSGLALDPEWRMGRGGARAPDRPRPGRRGQPDRRAGSPG